MIWPPSVLHLRIHNSRRHFRLWLPLFLIWPLMLMIFLALSPLVLVLAVVLWPSGMGKPLLFAGPVLFRVLCALRGLEVNVEQPSERVLISIR
jgi:hypothetical protein